MDGELRRARLHSARSWINNERIFNPSRSHQLGSQNCPLYRGHFLRHQCNRLLVPLQRTQAKIKT